MLRSFIKKYSDRSWVVYIGFALAFFVMLALSLAFSIGVWCAVAWSVATILQTMGVL